MRTRSVVCAATLGALLATGAAAGGPYQITGIAVSQDGNLVRTEYTVQAGAHPLDRFKAVRWTRASSAPAPTGAILLLPPLGPNLSFYEQGDPGNAAGTSIAEYFTLRGFDVWAYTPRFDGIPAGVCEAGLADCSVMAGWNLQSMVDDITFVRSQIEQNNPGVRVVAGGASMGGILAFALANAHPGDYAGIFPWEGMLATPDPVVRALNQGYCAALEAQLAAGLVYDGVGPNVFKQVTTLADTTPGGLTPIPLFPPTFTNHQIMVLLLSVPSPGPITMPVPNYIQMNGSLAEDRLFFASEARIFDNVRRFAGYAPLALVRDVSCSLAGVETGYVANLGSYTGPVLAIGGGRGFGPYMDDQLALVGSTDKTLLLEPDFGHIDHFMTPHHRDFVERPVYEWAKRVLGVP